jgi:hypothetical protein
MHYMGRLGILAAGLLMGIGGYSPSAEAQRWENKRGEVDPSSMHVRAGRIKNQAPVRIRDLPSASPAERARVALNGYALCRVSNDRPEFEGLIVAHPVPNLGAKAYKKFAEDNSAQGCLYDADMAFTHELMAGSGFLALLRLSYLRAENVPALHEVQYAALADITNHDGQYFVSTRSFAQCVVMAAPQKVATLLFSRELGKSEADAMTEVTPHLGPCLPEGQQISMGRTALFGWLAEAMYRSSKAQPAA